jgi:hypothetical protein
LVAEFPAPLDALARSWPKKEAAVVDKVLCVTVASGNTIRKGGDPRPVHNERSQNVKS